MEFVDPFSAERMETLEIDASFHFVDVEERNTANMKQLLALYLAGISACLEEDPPGDIARVTEHCARSLAQMVTTIYGSFWEREVQLRIEHNEAMRELHEQVARIAALIDARDARRQDTTE